MEPRIDLDCFCVVGGRRHRRPDGEEKIARSGCEGVEGPELDERSLVGLVVRRVNDLVRRAVSDEEDVADLRVIDRGSGPAVEVDGLRRKLFARRPCQRIADVVAEPAVEEQMVRRNSRTRHTDLGRPSHRHRSCMFWLLPISLSCFG